MSERQPGREERPSRLWLYALVAGGLTLGLLLIWARAFGKDPHRVPFMLEGKPAPAFTLQRLDSGETVSLEKLKGKPVVLNFWASWCHPCRQEQPVLDWAYQRWAKELHFFGVVFEDSEENARKYLAQTRPPYPQLIDPQSSMAVDYGVTGVPETYFIDREGIIRGKVAEPIDPQTMAAKVRELLASPSAAGGSP